MWTPWRSFEVWEIALDQELNATPVIPGEFELSQSMLVA